MYLKFKQKIVEHVKKAKKKTFLLHFSFRNFSLDWCNLIWFHMQKQCGIVPNFGLCCAMGLALAVEGLLSACYHLCPHSMTSQFGKFLMSDQLMTHSCIIYKCWWFFFFFIYIDFTFMYIICTLCFLKLYYARKSQVEQGSNSAYVFLAAVVCLVSWKFLHEMTYFSSFLIIVHLLTCMLVSIEIYESGHMKFAYLNPVKIYYRLQTAIRQSKCTVAMQKKNIFCYC